MGDMNFDFQKIALAIVLAVLTWVGNTVYKTSIQVAVINSKITAIENVVDSGVTDKDIKVLEIRIQRLENVVEKQK